MNDYDLLEQFVAFSKLGTLNEVARQFDTSQPTVTRNMKKVEEFFGLPLFNRKGTRISLNETGIYAAGQAASWLASTRNMIRDVRIFSEKTQNYTVGYAASLSLGNFIDLLSDRFSGVRLTTEQDSSSNRLIEGLKQHRYEMILLPFRPREQAFESIELITERLVICCPLTHPFSSRKSLSMKDLVRQEFVCPQKPTFWEAFLRKCLPDNSFQRISPDDPLESYVSYSEMLLFSSDLAEKRSRTEGNYRVAVPVSDSLATLTYYMVCRSEDKAKYL